MPLYTTMEKLDQLEDITYSKFERLDKMLKRIYTILDIILELVRKIMFRVGTDRERAEST